MPSAVIVGAGVGGLATAIALDRRGWDVQVLERWPRVVGIGAALGLWPEAQAVLDDIGIGDDVLAESLPYRQATVRNHRGRTLTKLPLARIERTAGRPVILISRARLMAIMLNALEGRVRIETGVKVESLDHYRQTADLVVGADGLRSTVRSQHISDASQPRPAGFTAWRGVVEREVTAYGEFWGPGLMFGMTPMEPGRTNWYAAVNQKHVPVVAEATTPSDLTILFEDWPCEIRQALSDSDAASLLRHEVFDLAPHLPSYWKGNVVVIGDAAHAMTPSLGQGACQALIDAGRLAHEVDQSMTDAGTVQLGLRLFDVARRPAAEQFVVNSRRMSQLAMADRWTRSRDLLIRLGSPLAR